MGWAKKGVYSVADTRPYPVSAWAPKGNTIYRKYLSQAVYAAKVRQATQINKTAGALERTRQTVDTRLCTNGGLQYVW